MNEKIVQWMNNYFYPDCQNNWDNKIFRKILLQYIQPNSIVLDVGAGSGNVKEMNFKDNCKIIYGIDPDERVKTNPFLHVGYVGLAHSMPFFKNNTFDIIFSDNVLEHVEDPGKFLKEIYRILKPEGFFINKTPNKNHYVPLIAILTPTHFHKFYNQIRGRKQENTFPTRYKLNSLSQQKRHFKKSGFKLDWIKFYEKRPEYLRIFFLTYPLGILYERVVNLLSLSKLKIVMISSFQKEDMTATIKCMIYFTSLPNILYFLVELL